MGKIQIDHTGSGGGITLSSDGTSLLIGGSAIGGADLYAAETTGSTDPTATGTLSLAIGSSASASSNDGVAIGTQAEADGSDKGVAIGYDAHANGTSGSFAFGTQTRATGNQSVALGFQTNVNGIGAIGAGYVANAAATFSTAIGYNATTATGSNSTALTKSYASGADSLAAAIATNSSSYGATGANSVAMGYQAKATGTKSIAIGDVATASSTSAVAIGDGPSASAADAMAIGESCVAGFSKSMAFGTRSSTRAIGQFVYGTGSLVSGGYAQYGNIVIHGRSADATQGTLVSDSSLQAMGTPGSSNQLSVPSYGAIAFDGMIVARGQGSISDTDCAAWKVEGLIRRESAVSTTTLVNSAITVIDNQPGWSLSLSADTTNGCLSVLVTGAASQNVKWVCTLRSTETIYNSY